MTTTLRITPSAQAVLDTVRAASEPITLADLSARSGVYYVTCSGQARVLEAHGLIRKVDLHRPIRYVAVIVPVIDPPGKTATIQHAIEIPESQETADATE